MAGTCERRGEQRHNGRDKESFMGSISRKSSPVSRSIGYDLAASPAMICQTMDVVVKAVNYLNPGQTPVLACDQPIYAMAKKIQWNWPSTYGESSIVMMFGGLHTELAALKALGTWIEGSGWTSALVQAGITTPGTADSFLKASHVSRTRHAHQITACALYTLMDKAYKHYCN